jgi:23S rRNA (cytosine1962-C5)-methyltransferase
MTELPYPTLRLRRNADKRVRRGHVWIFSNELENGFQELPPGTLVHVRDDKGHTVGTGTLNPHSLIAARLFTRMEEAIDRDFLISRADAALKLRSLLLIDTSSCRVVFSESDGLPGLILDKFGDVLVYQSLTAGMEKLMPHLLEWMQERFSPRAIVGANDSQARVLEGLPQVRGCVIGSLDGIVEFRQDGLRLLADPLQGQKTGFFLDQRLNRQRLQSFFRGGERVLDLFSYSGAFGLYALKAGASHVTFVDSSPRALELCKEAAQRNGYADKIKTIEADVFEWVKSCSDVFDVVSLDPPALAKNRSKTAAALRGYRDLNARALRLVKPGGLFATSSCSGLITPVNWREALEEAAFKSRRRVRYIAFGSQAPDHPVLALVPETEYLKFTIAVVDGSIPDANQ